MKKDLGWDSWQGEDSAKETIEMLRVFYILMSMILRKSSEDNEAGKPLINNLLPYYINCCRRQRALHVLSMSCVLENSLYKNHSHQYEKN